MRAASVLEVRAANAASAKNSGRNTFWHPGVRACTMLARTEKPANAANVVMKATAATAEICSRQERFKQVLALCI